MQLNDELWAAVRAAAARRGVDAAALGAAITAESETDLARVLGGAPAEAARFMERLTRAVTVQADFGAGCKLLTDDVAAEVVAVLQEL